MTDHPLLFRGTMVAALIEGRKCQTRRPAWRPYEAKAGPGFVPERVVGLPDGSIVQPTAAARIKVGDLIWVRESLSVVAEGLEYLADDALIDLDGNDVAADLWNRYAHEDGPDVHPTTVPSIHMPRWASRLTLVVTAVKIERLQDISDTDAAAEGIDLDGAVPGTDFNIDREWWPGGPQRQYRRLYERIHGKGAWAANPEVVAITFTVHKANIDAFRAAAVAA